MVAHATPTCAAVLHPACLGHWCPPHRKVASVPHPRARYDAGVSSQTGITKAHMVNQKCPFLLLRVGEGGL